MGQGQKSGILYAYSLSMLEERMKTAQRIVHVVLAAAYLQITPKYDRKDDQA